MPASRRFIALLVSIGCTGCGFPAAKNMQSNGYSAAGAVTPSTPTPRPSNSTAQQDPSCSSASLHLYSRDHFQGDELCFFGDGIVELRDFPLPSNSQLTWLGNVNGIETGIAPVFLTGSFGGSESFSWFYTPSFVDDIGSDLPPGLDAIVMTAGNNVDGTCGSGNCGYVMSRSGRLEVCGDGGCPNQQWCVNNLCCIADPVAACGGRECGTIIDNCGQPVDCGSLMGACADPQRSCTPAGQCCIPARVACAGQQCGTASDGCGNQLSCGTCDAGATCQSNQCVDTACRPRPCGSGSYWNPDDCRCEHLCNRNCN